MSPGLVAVPIGVVTVIGPVTAPTGTRTTILVELLETIAAVVPLV